MKYLIKWMPLCTLILTMGCSKKMATSKSTVTDTVTTYDWTKFSMGADLSYAVQMKANGVQYTDSGKINDIFSIFKTNGCNTVRLRLWHNPSAFTGGIDQQYNSLSQVETMIQQAKALGMAVNLDLHYSDTWADPSKQYTPSAWTGLSLSILSDSVYQYTLNVLNELKSKNLTPEMIQIGNETNSGMLWPVGQVVNNNFSSFATLLNAGIKAVRDFSQNAPIKPTIILHVAQLQNADFWVSNLISAGVTDFDVIGMSHYQDYSTVNNMSDITTLVNKLKSTYTKKVMIVETAYWNNTKDSNGYAISETPVAGYPFTNAGQYQYLKDLTQAVIKGGGTGVQYWAPDYISSYGGEMTARAMVDFSGNTLPAIKFMKFTYQF